MRTADKINGATLAISADATSAQRDIEALIDRFDDKHRAGIRRLVTSSPRLLDMATTFPGALFAIAAGRGKSLKRRRAVTLIERGAPLKDVAHALDLPLWLRRLPPEAFNSRDVVLPRSELFARRIANHLPTSSEHSAFWLASVAFGVQACDDYFALWLAQQSIFLEDGDPQALFALLAAYAWFSNADRTRARDLILVPWRPEMALDTAVCAAKSWLNRMRLVLQIERDTLQESWLEPGEALGFRFEPLMDDTALLGEAQAMQNCADQYADRLARDKCRLFSVRNRGIRVATLEIGPHPREAGVLAIAQLKARHNLPAGNDIWQAAHTWMGAQKNLKRSLGGPKPERPFNEKKWRTLMAEYRIAAGDAPWIPERANREAFALLESGIAELARRAGITSWLFT